jgi:hypothetical protein
MSHLVIELLRGTVELWNLEMKSKITWTDKRREIAELAGQGKEFMEITALGYSKNMTSIVLNALKDGQKQELEQESKGGGTEGGSGIKRELVGTATPKSAPILFRLGLKEIVLDPLELNRQYSYYEDLARKDGLGYSFSEVLTIGIQLVWIMKQDIPITENMLRAIFYGYK